MNLTTHRFTINTLLAAACSTMLVAACVTVALVGAESAQAQPPVPLQRIEIVGQRFVPTQQIVIVGQRQHGERVAAANPRARTL